MNHNALCYTKLTDSVAQKHKLCTVTGEEYVVTVPLDKYLLWRGGALIQDCFPELDADQREFLISGFTPAEWDRAFKDMEE